MVAVPLEAAAGKGRCREKGRNGVESAVERATKTKKDVREGSAGLGSSVNAGFARIEGPTS